MNEWINFRPLLYFGRRRCLPGLEITPNYICNLGFEFGPLDVSFISQNIVNQIKQIYWLFHQSSNSIWLPISLRNTHCNPIGYNRTKAGNDRAFPLPCDVCLSCQSIPSSRSLSMCLVYYFAHNRCRHSHSCALPETTHESWCWIGIISNCTGGRGFDSHQGCHPFSLLSDIIALCQAK